MQRVKLGNMFSEWQVMERGVPQGGVVGTMFFNVFFINDLLFTNVNRGME